MTAPRGDLRLALFVGADAKIVTVADVLADHDAGRPLPAVSPNFASMSLVLGGTERWGVRLSLGALGVVVRQLPPARARLADGVPALVRAGVLDVPTAGYVLFEPADDEVVASLAGTQDRAVTGWFPDGPHGDELYDYVAEHRDELVREAVVEPQRMARLGLLEDLERETTTGRKAIELLGPGVM
jgi:hypothetical protein